MLSKISSFPFVPAYLYLLFEMVPRVCFRLLLDFTLDLHSNEKCFASSTPDLHNGHIQFFPGMFSNLSVSKAEHVQPVLRRVKIIRFDPLVPVQTLAQRCTLQMKCFIFINYIMNLNCGCHKTVFSLPKYDMIYFVLTKSPWVYCYRYICYFDRRCQTAKSNR